MRGCEVQASPAGAWERLRTAHNGRRWHELRTRDRAEIAEAARALSWARREWDAEAGCWALPVVWYYPGSDLARVELPAVRDAFRAVAR